MIHVQVDLSNATPDEIAAFYALPGVGHAMDSLSQLKPDVQLRLDLPVSTDKPREIADTVGT